MNPNQTSIDVASLLPTEQGYDKNWWVAVSPRNGPNGQPEGPWSEWVLLARRILELDELRKAPGPAGWTHQNPEMDEAIRQGLAAKQDEISMMEMGWFPDGKGEFRDGAATSTISGLMRKADIVTVCCGAEIRELDTGTAECSRCGKEVR